MKIYKVLFRQFCHLIMYISDKKHKNSTAKQSAVLSVQTCCVDLRTSIS